MTGRTSIERRLRNLEGAVSISSSDTIRFYDLIVFSSTYPEKELLEQTNGQLTTRSIRFSLPAKGTVLDLPEERILCFSEGAILIGVAIVEIGEGLNAFLDFFGGR